MGSGIYGGLWEEEEKEVDEMEEEEEKDNEETNLSWLQSQFAYIL